MDFVKICRTQGTQGTVPCAERNITQKSRATCSFFCVNERSGKVTNMHQN